jgi:hypothetical protein
MTGGHPRNPTTKAGYRLEFADDFDGPALDTTRWLPFHLPQWSSRARSAPRYRLADGCLILEIGADQAPWCPEFDGENRVSSLQTGVFSGPADSTIGQHRFNPASVVREAQAEVHTYTPQFGYFETRLKAVASPTNHVALWMIGFEDAPERSAEIAICEIMGDKVGAASSQVGYGLHPWSDATITDAFHQDMLPIDAREFHVYAAEWTPKSVTFLVDNRPIRTIHQSPQYPMQFMLGIYERPSVAKPTDPIGPYPKEFVVDYFRAWQPVSGY